MVSDNIFHLGKLGHSDKTKSSFKLVLTQSFLMGLEYPVLFSLHALLMCFILMIEKAGTEVWIPCRHSDDEEGK